MNAFVRGLILACVAVAALSAATAILLFSVRAEIGGPLGILYWSALALIASAMPVRLPKGVVASVSAAPVLASIVLGGPVAAAIVGALGTTDSRELRGQVPWYGTLYNHASVVIAAVFGGAAYVLLLRVAPHQNVVDAIWQFVALVIGAAIFYVINWTLSVAAVSARTGVSMRAVWASDLGGVAVNLIGLVPLAWLMAQIYLLPNGMGWWATLLFVVPLFTTRLAYHRYVETREMFEQTIGALANAVDARDRYTRGHSQRVSHIAEAMCRVMNIAEPEIEKGAWSDVFRDGLGLYSALVIGGIAMHATQMLVIAIIMPTIVADIGGASFYTWAAMLYTIGAIVGASSTGVVWGRLGPRRSSPRCRQSVRRRSTGS